MRAAVFHAEGHPLAIEDRQTPTAGPGEIVLRVAYCGICGSDLHATEPNPFPLEPGTVLGHEFAGAVVQSGSPDFAPGDMAVGLPLQECDDCRPSGRGCRDGLGIHCPRNRIVGMSAAVPGAYAEYLRLPAHHALKIPPGLDPKLAALTEPLAVGLHAVRAAGEMLGKRVLVLGAGPIGLAVVLFARMAGARIVAASEPGAARRALAERMGAAGLDPASGPTAEAFARAADGPPDIVLECVGAPGLLRQAMELAPLRGRIVVVGVCRQDDSIAPRIGIRKELSLRFVLGYDRDEFATVLDLLAQGRIDAAPMVTGTIGLDALPAVFEALRRPGAHAKVLVEPGR